jgi:hypothetical protein
VVNPALRLERQLSATGFDQRALERSTLLLVGRRDAPVLSCLAYFARLLGIPTVVADDSYPRPPLDEEQHLALDVAPEVMRLDVSVDLASALLPGFLESGCVTLIADPASCTKNLGGFGVPPIWVTVTDAGAFVLGDFVRAKLLSEFSTGLMPFAIANRVAASLMLDHIARAGGYSDPSGTPMPGPEPMTETGRWFGSSLLHGPFLPTEAPLRVHIVGQGGLGSAILRDFVSTLALRDALRGGSLILTDPDDWGESNFNRVLTVDQSGLFQPKAVTNARYAEQRLTGLGVSISADVSYFDPQSLGAAPGPRVVVAATDSLDSRREVIEAATDRWPSALIVYAGGDFEWGSCRGHVPDQIRNDSLCFVHGPESIDLADEALPDPFAFGCTAVGQPANVLTNVLVASAVVEIVATWRARGFAPAHQHLVSWMNPEHLFHGPEIQVGCDCAEESWPGR